LTLTSTRTKINPTNFFYYIELLVAHADRTWPDFIVL
jgi:hypothetical protein